jgi:hypothetical protein
MAKKTVLPTVAVVCVLSILAADADIRVRVNYFAVGH